MIEVDFKNTRQVNIASKNLQSSTLDILPMGKNNIPPFDFKLFIKDKKKFEEFMISNIRAIEIESPQEVSHFLKTGSKNLFFASYFKETPLLSEFIYRSLQRPKALAKFSGIFIEFNKLILFATMMLFSFICSSFLAQYKMHDNLSVLQYFSSKLASFLLINSLRVGFFSMLFSQHYSLLFEVYQNSVMAMTDQYPYLKSFISLIS